MKSVMMETFKVTISILTYNRERLLRKLLSSLRGISYQKLEIIVIDNCSTDNTERTVKEEFPEILYEKTEKNIGIAARNREILEF